MKKRILIIDDEAVSNRLLRFQLEPQGYQVYEAVNGSDGIKLAYEHHPDLIILDVMMSGMDGYEVCRRLRELSDVPIGMLTAKTSEDDVVRGFEVGADDYIKKPFAFRELQAHIQGVLRRTDGKDSGHWLYDDGRLRIDLEQGHVYCEGKLVHLTPTEFRLLSYLVRNLGRVISHAELLEAVWGEAYLDAKECLSLYIRYLREKLELDPAEPRHLRNQWGTGYWFSPAALEEAAQEAY